MLLFTTGTDHIFALWAWTPAITHGMIDTVSEISLQNIAYYQMAQGDTHPGEIHIHNFFQKFQRVKSEVVQVHGNP